MSKYLANLLGMEEVTDAFNIVYKIGLCLVVIIVATIAVKIVKHLINKHFSKTGRKGTITTVSYSIVKYVIYFFTIYHILTIWGVDPASMIAIGGVASLTIGLGAQSTIQDMLSGIFILTENQFGVGDVVKIEGYMGTVESVGMRTTRLRSADGDVYIIPNGQIKIVTNMSKGFNRAVVDVGIAYSENIDEVIKILNKELARIYDKKEVDGLLHAPTVLGVENLADSSVVLRVRADCAVGENWNVERQLRRLIKNAFDKEGIEIPFPQQVVHIEKGEK